MIDYIYTLPKAELHIHIEGSLEPELLFKLAQRNQIKLPYNSLDEVKKAYQFNRLQDFLDIYYQACQVLLHEQDFFDLTWAYLLKCRENNVVHAEIFFDPQTHTFRGVDFNTVVSGISRALQEAKQQLGMSSYLIMCFLRHLSEEDALKTLNQALDHKDKIKGIGLDSSEQGNPPQKFAKVFALARQKGFKLVAHAGEEAGPDYIWQAIDVLNVDRIDHGVRCIEDPKLLAYLKEKQIPLTVCPLSNIKLKVFENMAAHSLNQLLENGLLITINSDDPSYFDGYINANFQAIQSALKLKQDIIKQLVMNSFIASFLPEDIKQQHLKRIECI